MPFFNPPNAFRQPREMAPRSDIRMPFIAGARTQSDILHVQSKMAHPPPLHSSHPSLPHLTLLVFEAVLEVVCVSLPGYIVARQGMFNAEMQKFVAQLNVSIFTPCLIFTKLASQLTTDTLVDLAIIPVIFVVQTLLSFACAFLVSRLFRFEKRPRNFVVAMGVFGNSNSLPISLVLSLSQTIKGLHWDKVPGDNDDEVAARGILYLLIFQQLGQVVRWTWGYNVLLAPPDAIEGTQEHTNSRLEGGPAVLEEEADQHVASPTRSASNKKNMSGSDDTNIDRGRRRKAGGSQSGQDSSSGEQTPINYRQHSSSSISSASSSEHLVKRPIAPDISPTPANGNAKSTGHAPSFPQIPSASTPDVAASPGFKGTPGRIRKAVRNCTHALSSVIARTLRKAFSRLPAALQVALRTTFSALKQFSNGLWAFMNPPLWAMLAAIFVASIPSVQHFFFAEGTFFKNSVTSAIRQSGGVAVPLILVVLGANLARNTLPSNGRQEDKKEERKLLIASLISRMLLPTVIMAPLLAITAKFVPVSILDDPIFIIVCFLITGAPSALQLAQICQINDVYMGAMSRLLFQSYVVWILPSTLILVMCALEVVEWAQR